METYYRKVIKITAQDSPNVQLALRQIEAGLEPTNEIVVPGVLTWQEYKDRRATWDDMRQQIGLDAEFPDDSTLLLFPKAALEASNKKWLELKASTRTKRIAKAMGIDSGRGQARSPICVIDELGILELVSEKTPDTNQIVKLALAIGKKWNVPPERWVFDDGGGGFEHACRLRAMGLPVQTVPFGGRISLEPRRGLTMVEERKRVKEQAYVYKNRRVEMHDSLSIAIKNGFAIPPASEGPQYARLLKQLAPIPLDYDDNGRQVLPPKEELIALHYNGESPDEADATILAYFGLTHKPRRAVAGAG
jgi:hypothetical protein